MSKPTALELALVAAVLDPARAKAEPRRAVAIASKLVEAAQERIDAPGKFARSTRETWDKFDADKSIPEADRMSLVDAFKYARRIKGFDHYKTFNGFLAALRKEFLIAFTRAGEEVTSKRLVDDLLRLRAERKKLADRLRKKAGQTKKSKNRRRKSEPQKRNAAREKRKSNR